MVLQGLNTSITYSPKEEGSFIASVKGVATEKPVKIILNEMLRFSLVGFDGDKVTLIPLSERNLKNDSEQGLLE